MTEYKCGSAETCQFGEMCKPNYDIGGCSHFKQKKPQTNEEYLQTCNTEQLAEVFYIVFHNNADRVLNAFWDKHKEVFKKNVVEWLKQPHTIKE